MKELRPYQVEGLENLKRTLRQRVKRVVLQLPTGGGKTLIAATIAQGVLAKSNRMAFVVPRISLIDQTVGEFYKEEVRDVGVIQANHPLTDWGKPIQVCSIDTVRSKGAFPDAKVVIFDEAHILTDTHKKWMAEHPDTIFIALSATPWTRGMGKFFETLLIVATMKELMELGWLSQYRAFGIGTPDLSGVKNVGDDYAQGQLSAHMGEQGLVANAVETWKSRHGKDRTMCFAVDRAHAKLLQSRFEAEGIPCGYQDAYTDSQERADIERKFHNYSYAVVVSVGTLSLGTDWDCRCISDCQPTKSRIKFVQKFGRGVRLARPGSDPKEFLIYLDHAGNIGGRDDSLGYPELIWQDHLDDGKPKVAEERKAPLPKPCPQCQFLKPPRTAVCPNCGFKAQVVSNIVEGDGELVELKAGEIVRQKKGAKREYTNAEKRRFHAELLSYKPKRYQAAIDKGETEFEARERARKWVLVQFKEKFKEWPSRPWANDAPLEPSFEVANWVKSRMIKWFQGREKAARMQAAE